MNELDTTDFLKYFFDDEGYLEIRLLGDGIPDRRYYSSLEDIDWDELSNLNEYYNIYFGVCRRKDECGRKECVDKMPGIWVDVDIKNNFDDKEQALEFINEVIEAEDLNPTFLVDSGNGFHLYFIFDEPIKVTDDNREELQHLVKSVGNLFKGDAVQDVSRIMRLPGFNNVKDPNNPKPCIIKEANI